MLKIKLFLSIIVTGVLVYVLHTKHGDVPPVGKLFDPFAGFWQNAELRSHNYSDNVSFNKLKNKTIVVLDSNLVPHIFANNDYELFFAQGYVTAKYRLWQMDLQTRAAGGMISEIIGPKALEIDKYQRRIGMLKSAELALEAMLADPVTKNAVVAYSEGVNAYINQLQPKDYPLEYKLLDLQPAPWSALRSALLLKLMTYDLSAHNDDLKMSNILQKYGIAITNELFPDYPFRDEPIIPAGTPWDFDTIVSPSRPIDYISSANSIKLPNQPDPDNGSNNWAVSGQKTASGYPILANDPHLQLNLPSIWFQVHLNAPGINVNGVSLPGAPFVIVGYNENISWGVTNVGSDVLDWYQVVFKDDQRNEYFHDSTWKPVVRRVEKIAVRGGLEAQDTVLYTHHGPLVYLDQEKPFKSKVPVGFAMRWIAHESSNDARTFYMLNKAANYEGYVEALKGYASPAQNFAYADRENIALWVNGRFPAKWREQGKFLLDGTDNSYDWQGWIPQQQNPHIINPARGFVSSANQFSADTTYPYYLDWQFATYERGARINERLSAMNNITVDSMRLLQVDNYNVLASEVLPLMLQQIDKGKLNSQQQQVFNIIRNWDYYNNAQSKGATIFEIWWSVLDKAIWKSRFSGEYLRYPSRDVTAHLILHDTTGRWFDNEKTQRKETLQLRVQESFAITAESLLKKLGKPGEAWEWGRYKNTSLEHIAKIPALGKKNIITGGGRTIVNATSERHGPSWRMVVELGPVLQGYGIYPGGQSGNPGSRFYDNMVDEWTNGQLNPLLFAKRPEELEKTSIGTIIVGP
jgi:penicillin amidase